MDDDNTDEDNDYGSDDDIDDNNTTKPYDYADAAKMIINMTMIHILINN